LIVVWFFHLTVGGMAGVAAWLRVWTRRYDDEGKKDRLAYALTYSLSALPLDSLMAIVLVFMARGVKFTWKFTIVLFAFTLVEDLIRLPLIVLLIKPRKI